MQTPLYPNTRASSCVSPSPTFSALHVRPPPKTRPQRNAWVQPQCEVASIATHPYSQTPFFLFYTTLPFISSGLCIIVHALVRVKKYTSYIERFLQIFVSLSSNVPFSLCSGLHTPHKCGEDAGLMLSAKHHTETICLPIVSPLKNPFILALRWHRDSLLLESAKKKGYPETMFLRYPTKPSRNRSLSLCCLPSLPSSPYLRSSPTTRASNS